MLDKPENLKLLITVSMTMAVSISFSIIAFPKIFNIFGFKTTCGAIFFPLSYTLSDLIGYFYGKKLALYAFKISILLDIAFSICGIIVFYIPPSSSFAYQSVYQYLFIQHGIFLSIFAALGIYCSQRLNLFLFFSKKIEKYWFPLRSAFSSLPADILVAMFALIPIFWYEKSLLNDLQLAINSAFLKCIMSIIYSFIVYTIVIYLKETYQYSTKSLEQ